MAIVTEARKDAFVRSLLPLSVLKAVVVYWAALKIAALYVGYPHADEAYYWLWGQHPALSYLDHPPLHAWAQTLVARVFGWNLFAVRFLSLLTAAATFWILYVWARRLSSDNWRPRFWLTAALFYSSPLMLLYTTVGIQDRLLVVCALCAIHFFALFLADFRDGKRRYPLLYLGAFLLGLATLTKYSGVLLGIGVAVAIIARNDLRPLLRSPHLYLAAALSILMQAPVLYWNATHGGASAQLHLSYGFQGVAIGSAHVGQIALESVVFLSPFALIPMVRFVFARGGGGFAGTLHDVGRSVFVVSTLSVLAFAFFRDALFYWNIVAYAMFFAVGAWCYRTAIGQGLQIVWGLALSTALFVHLSLLPILPLPNVESLYGWDQIAAQVKQARSEHDVTFAAATGWRFASQLAYAIGDKDVASLSQQRDGFSDWFDEAGVAGRDAIILVEPGGSRASYVGSRFESLTKLSDVEVDLFGRSETPFELYVGRGFIPAVADGL